MHTGTFIPSLKRANLRRKWSTIPKAGWSLGYASAGRTIWIAGAHRGDGKRFVVMGDEILTALS